jgi:hypothetical protein
MDPDIAWATLTDAERPFDERCNAGVDLLTWLLKGGFVPTPAGPFDHGQLSAYCQGFLDAAAAVREMPEVDQLRSDLLHVVDGNTHHIVDSSARLLEALSD